MTDEAESLGIDLARVAIAGASGGGGLTAALALLVRDKGGPELIFQMPLYPMLDNHSASNLPYAKRISYQEAKSQAQSFLEKYNAGKAEETSMNQSFLKSDLF